MIACLLFGLLDPADDLSTHREVFIQRHDINNQVHPNRLVFFGLDNNLNSE